MKTPAQANAKWVASTSVGQQTWIENLTGTTKPIVGAAIAQRAVMQQNFAQSTAPGGVWERRLEAVGDAGVKQAARDKANNYGQGIQQASGRTQMVSIGPYSLSSIQRPGTLPAQHASWGHACA